MILFYENLISFSQLCNKKTLNHSLLILRLRVGKFDLGLENVWQSLIWIKDSDSLSAETVSFHRRNSKQNEF